MGFVMGLLVRYVIFTVATFMVGGIMGHFLTGKVKECNKSCYRA